MSTYTRETLIITIKEMVRVLKKMKGPNHTPHDFVRNHTWSERFFNPNNPEARALYTASRNLDFDIYQDINLIRKNNQERKSKGLPLQIIYRCCTENELIIAFTESDYSFYVYSD